MPENKPTRPGVTATARIYDYVWCPRCATDNLKSHLISLGGVNQCCGGNKCEAYVAGKVTETTTVMLVVDKKIIDYNID